MDFEKALTLLRVHEKASGHPHLKHIVEAAMDALTHLHEVKEEHEPIPPEEPAEENGHIERRLGE